MLPRKTWRSYSYFLFIYLDMLLHNGYRVLVQDPFLLLFVQRGQTTTVKLSIGCLIVLPKSAILTSTRLVIWCPVNLRSLAESLLHCQEEFQFVTNIAATLQKRLWSCKYCKQRFVARILMLSFSCQRHQICAEDTTFGQKKTPQSHPSKKMTIVMRIHHNLQLLQPKLLLFMVKHQEL